MSTKPLRILAVEPYYGGSHRAVLDGLVERYPAEWTLLTLPARKWKWRMRGAAITLADRLHECRGAADEPAFDLVFASTFVNLCEFMALAGPPVRGVPTIVYFHENQLVYPNRHTAEWDFQFPLTNITSALAATHCAFNTRWNLDRFVGEIPAFLKNFPDAVPRGVAERIAAKSSVVSPPFDGAPFDAVPVVRDPVPRIVWPHRWEHDKHPEEFVSALHELDRRGLAFEVAFAGQVFRDRPEAIERALAFLGDRVVPYDEREGRGAYARLLRSSDIAVSTANNEFFGIAMMEAAYAGCDCLVPDRLAYPELYPAESRYADVSELVEKLAIRLAVRPEPGLLRSVASAHTFDACMPAYAELFESVAARG